MTTIVRRVSFVVCAGLVGVCAVGAVCAAATQQTVLSAAWAVMAVGFGLSARRYAARRQDHRASPARRDRQTEAREPANV